ncbi:diguanylate cyclase domain-containing protein [Bowmanella dokdonensis]|uniref:diguanylate cyclase n=1 Tax=Bowmanella dokdonensis TaxID=751969 RepID=A0A939DRJ8_9ALTE|nr:diguanylate cyclase [Bowmanella dokdonensis]MBN7826586.1 diguanylate cyclase [Bowmanella dokdonensis]
MNLPLFSEVGSQTVLVVDDQPVNLKILGQALSKDYQVLLASSGEQALRMARDQLPDLILLDIIMKDMDGYQACRQLKSDPLTQNIPIIFSTAMDSVEDEVRGLEEGATDYITKPFNVALVLARVRNQLQLKKKTDLLERLVSLDGLTEIPNRRYFEQRLEEEWRRAERGEECLCLAMADIDAFKQFNDNYGHGAGDLCLQKVARCLSSNAQRSGDLVARYGGEEFAVLLPATDLDAGRLVVERLRQSVEDLAIPHRFSPVTDVVTLSVGLACIRVSLDMEKERLWKEADKQLYGAKQAGRNRVHTAWLHC